MAEVLDLTVALLETVVTAATSAVSGVWWLVAEGLPLVLQVVLYVVMSIWYVLSTVLQTAAVTVLVILDMFSSAFHFGLPYVEDWWAWSVEAIPTAIDYIISGTYSLYSGISTGISTGFTGAWNIGTFFVDVIIPLVVAAVSYTFHFLWFLLANGFSVILWIVSTIISTCSLLLSTMLSALHVPLDFFHIPWKATEDSLSDSDHVFHAVGDWGSHVVWQICVLVVVACLLVSLLVTAPILVYRLVPYCLALQQCWYWLKHKVIHNTPQQRPQAQPLHHQHQDIHRHVPPAQTPAPVLQRRPLTQPAPPAGGSEVQRLQHELEQRRLCVVCLDEEREMMLKPCNHLCVCGECVQRLDHTCPICRRRFQGSERVYT